jgi:hypothetical protein
MLPSKSLHAVCVCAAAATDYWNFWALVTICWFFAWIVNALFNEYWCHTLPFNLPSAESHVGQLMCVHFVRFDCDESEMEKKDKSN